ncbi:MAG: GNAT family N-acetyltransferase [Herpetosiphonaceae bacterium]|nr:GNAT family N-acetyltransferase [Herpetosiphonaceae bacterium]
MLRRVVQDDASTLARLRQAMWEEMNPGEPVDPSFRERTSVYWDAMLGDAGAAGWLVEVDGEPIGMVTLLLHHHPPLPWGERRRGYVTGVYVAPEHRRQGHGRALLQAAIAFGREHGLQQLELRTSEQGRLLYTALGFTSHELLMLKLD